MQNELSIADVPPKEREKLEAILEESFEGIYLWHAKRTLRDIELVRVASLNSEAAGLVMLRSLDKKLGYVYYIAVAGRMRAMGIGGKLLDNSLEYFSEKGKLEVYASVEVDNEASLQLFNSRGFRATSMEELGGKYGVIKANLLRMKMLLVHGEVLLVKELSGKLGGALP
jgi:ribosomal protein S18 acetylase RimI-like enzyme